MDEKAKSLHQTRNTEQRRLVLRVVQEYMGHPSADNVYDQARKNDPKISRGTVYRNLNILAQQGHIRQMPMPAGPIRYDSMLTPHYHFCCHCCGEIINTSIPYDERLNDADIGVSGYITEWHRLVLVGLCPLCAAKAVD